MPAFPPGVHLKGGKAGGETLAKLAREFYAPIIPIVQRLREQGLSLRAIARELEKQGIKTQQGWERWNATQVSRILQRSAVNEAAPPTAGGPIPHGRHNISTAE